MSTDKDRKRRHVKCMHNFKAGDDKKRIKGFDNDRKKRVKEAIEEAIEELVEYNEEEQNIIKKNIKAIRKGL